jgi:mRNA interferase MazF
MDGHDLDGAGAVDGTRGPLGRDQLHGAHRSGGSHLQRIHCDALVSVPKSMLTDFVASLPPLRMRALDQALQVALALA